MAPSSPVDRREKLTLAQLASYDDILTDALVDRVRSLRSTNVAKWQTYSDSQIPRHISGPKFGRIVRNISQLEASLKVKSRLSYSTMSSLPKTCQARRRRSLIFLDSRSFLTGLDLKGRRSGSDDTSANISPSIFQIVRSKLQLQIAILSQRRRLLYPPGDLSKREIQ